MFVRHKKDKVERRTKNRRGSKEKEEVPKDNNRDVHGIIKNSLKMPWSRGRMGPGGVKGQRPCGGPTGATPPGRN